MRRDVWRQLLPASSKSSGCRAAVISASVVPGAKFEAWTVKGPAEPFIVRPGPCCGWVVEVPFRAPDATLLEVGVAVKELFREGVILALPLSISLAILEARALDWLSRLARLAWEGVVEEGREGGLKGFFWTGVLLEDVRCGGGKMLACEPLVDAFGIGGSCHPRPE